VGQLTIANTAEAEVTARFGARGTYVLRATANDGALSSKADVTVSVPD